MRPQAVPGAICTHSHRYVRWISYLLIFIFILRRVIELNGTFSILLALSLTLLFTLLYISQPIVSVRYKAYPRIYLIIQMVLVQLLGLFQEYLDTYALLYIVLGFQVIVLFDRKEAIVWLGLFIVSIVGTLCLEFGLFSGFGRAIAYIVIGVIFISFEIQYAQHEDALAESQLLLDELREAHKKLEEYALQTERLAAAQEHERIIQELYDAVGQKIFAIQLSAEATRLKYDRDPHQAVDLLDNLQEQTQNVLNQMRQLIEQWRPG